MEPTTIETTSQANYPLLTDRIQSTLIDTLLVIGLMFATAALIDKMGDPPVWIRIVIFFTLFGIYEPVCTSMGCTLGNYLKNIRVRQVDDTSQKINILQAIIRYVLKFCLGWLSFLTIHFNKERRAIHDLFAGSVMINKD